MPNPCENEGKEYKEAKDKYDEAYDDYMDILDEEAELNDEIEETKEARFEKTLWVAGASILAGAFSAAEEYGDSGTGRVGSAIASGLATATSTSAAASDWVDYDKDITMAEKNLGRLDRRKNRSLGKFEEAEKEFLDSEKELYHCEHGQSKELQFDEEGNEADEDDIDMSYGEADIDDEDEDDFFTMGEPTVEDELPDGDVDIRNKEYKNVADTKGDYYEQDEEMPDGDADLPDYMPLGDLDY